MTSKEFEAKLNKLSEAEQTFEGLQQPALEVDRVRKALLANIRHDLKTPINAIIGYSEMLLEDARELGYNRIVADLGKIRAAGKRLLRLVNEILDPAKIEAGKVDASLEAFEAHLRHELRTPLNTVVGYTEILLEDARGLGLKDFISDLQKINTAGKQLFNFLEDIIRMSKVETSNLDLTLEPSNSKDFVREAVATISFISESNDVSKRITSATVLVVDDNEMVRDLLSRHLERQGYRVTTAQNGREALEFLAAQRFDLVLLDIMMPELNGYQVLQRIRADSVLRYIPVIVISALDEMDSVVGCINLGATDYLPKPINPVLLQARVNASLAAKRMHDMEQAHLEQLQVEQEKSEKLLLNILPKPIAERLKQGEGIIADYFPEATVLFADLVGFTAFAVAHSPISVVQRLDTVFSVFDKLAEAHQLEKIKTIGDGYMVVGGIPLPRGDHAEAVANMALDMQIEIARINEKEVEPLQIRIGIHSGPVVAGIIGTKKFAYDLWGDTVNMASRIESGSIPGGILVSYTTYLLLRDQYLLQPYGEIHLKGKGKAMTYVLAGRSG
jgi:adenylate cyclase